MIKGFDNYKEIHPITINDDELWQKDVVLNQTLHSISWTAFRVHKTLLWFQCQTKSQVFAGHF